MTLHHAISSICILVCLLAVPLGSSLKSIQPLPHDPELSGGTQSSSSSAATGTYLNVSSGITFEYNAETGTLTQSEAIEPQHDCVGDDYVSQCGDCQYAGGEWTSPFSSYTTGRCASVDARNAQAVSSRADVRLVRSSDDDWWATTIVTYHDSEGHELRRERVWTNDCSEDAKVVAYCDGAVDTQNVALNGALLGARYACIYVQIFSSKVANSHPELAAIGCADL